MAGETTEMTRRLLLACAIAVLPGLAVADDIYLKGGGKVTGRILSRTDTSVEIDVGAGRVTLPMSAVLRIEERRSPLDDYYDRAGALRADDGKGWLELGRWATRQGLGTQARQAFERVLAIDPSSAEANRAVGHVLLDGVWVTEEQSYLARGFVNFDGEWMLPPEREGILRERQGAAEAQQRQLDAEVRAREAELRAQEAEARARDAEAAARQTSGIPVWWGWGSWGPWPIWPSPPSVLPQIYPDPRPPHRPGGRPPNRTEVQPPSQPEVQPPTQPPSKPSSRPTTKPLPMPGARPGGKPG